MAKSEQSPEQPPQDMLGTLANMSFQTLCQEIIALPDRDDALQERLLAASDTERSRLDLLIALKNCKLGDIAPLFANADDAPANARIGQSDTANTMLALLTALKATTGTAVE